MNFSKIRNFEPQFFSIFYVPICHEIELFSVITTVLKNLNYVNGSYGAFLMESVKREEGLEQSAVPYCCTV